MRTAPHPRKHGPRPSPTTSPPAEAGAAPRAPNPTRPTRHLLRRPTSPRRRSSPNRLKPRPNAPPSRAATTDRKTTRAPAPVAVAAAAAVVVVAGLAAAAATRLSAWAITCPASSLSASRNAAPIEARRLAQPQGAELKKPASTPRAKAGFLLFAYKMDTISGIDPRFRPKRA